MGAWKYAGSPYLPGSDTAHRIEGKSAWQRQIAKLEREQAAKGQASPHTTASGSELATEPQPEPRR